MYQTTCEIDEKEYPLTFSKASTKDGELINGVLFTHPAIEFKFMIGIEDKIIPPFQPIDAPLKTQTAILTSIREYDTSEEGGFFE